MKKFRGKVLIVICIFLCMYILTFIYQNIPRSIQSRSHKINLLAHYNDDTQLNKAVYNSLRRVAAFCKLGKFGDCERNLLLLGDVYDSFLPRFPSGDQVYDKTFLELHALRTSPTLFIFDFIAEGDSLKSEEYYVSLINRCIGERLYNELVRRENYFKLEAQGYKEVASRIFEQPELGNEQRKLEKVYTGISEEFKNIKELIKISKEGGVPPFLLKEKMNISTIATTQDATLFQKLLRSLLVSLFFSIYCWAFYDFYKKSKQ